MLARLSRPGGALGALSLTAALFLGLVGVAGVVWLCALAATDSRFWSPGPVTRLGISLVLFGFIASGAVGFLVMDRQPRLGVLLAVSASIIFTLLLIPLIVPLVLGPTFAIVAVNRGKVLREADPFPSDHVPADDTPPEV